MTIVAGDIIKYTDDPTDSAMYYFKNEVSIVRVDFLDEDDCVWVLAKENSIKNKRHFHQNLLCLGHKDDAVFSTATTEEKLTVIN